MGPVGNTDAQLPGELCATSRVPLFKASISVSAGTMESPGWLSITSRPLLAAVILSLALLKDKKDDTELGFSS